MTRIRRFVVLVLLVAALLLFVAFHLMHLKTGERGWDTWRGIWEIFHQPEVILKVPMLAMAVASFLMFSILVVASPFLTGVWTRSRLAWIVAIISSGLVTGVVWGIYQNRPGHLSAGEWCLMISLMLNFVGLLLARPRWLKKSGPSWSPESHAAV